MTDISNPNLWFGNDSNVCNIKCSHSGCVAYKKQQQLLASHGAHSVPQIPPYNDGNMPMAVPSTGTVLPVKEAEPLSETFTEVSKEDLLPMIVVMLQMRGSNGEIGSYCVSVPKGATILDIIRAFVAKYHSLKTSGYFWMLNVNGLAKSVGDIGVDQVYSDLVNTDMEPNQRHFFMADPEKMKEHAAQANVSLGEHCTTAWILGLSDLLSPGTHFDSRCAMSGHPFNDLNPYGKGYFKIHTDYLVILVVRKKDGTCEVFSVNVNLLMASIEEAVTNLVSKDGINGNLLLNFFGVNVLLLPMYHQLCDFVAKLPAGTVKLGDRIIRVNEYKPYLSSNCPVLDLADIRSIEHRTWTINTATLSGFNDIPVEKLYAACRKHSNKENVTFNIKTNAGDVRWHVNNPSLMMLRLAHCFLLGNKSADSTVPADKMPSTVNIELKIDLKTPSSTATPGKKSAKKSGKNAGKNAGKKAGSN